MYCCWKSIQTIKIINLLLLENCIKAQTTTINKNLKYFRVKKKPDEKFCSFLGNFVGGGIDGFLK